MQRTRIARAVTALGLLLIAGCGHGGSAAGDAGSHDSGPMPLSAGSVCGKDSDCLSGSCRTHCCAFSCSPDPVCGVTSCDTAGTCVYPDGPCGTSSCDPSTSLLTTSNCMQGICQPLSNKECPAHFGCADASVCATTCTTASDCAAQAYCYDGGCYPMATAGSPCLVDAGCLSGNCGSTAQGPALCCAGACLSADATCGATACSGRGECIYPSNLTPCSSTSCDAGYYTKPGQCDGNGSCVAQTGTCTPFACGPNDVCATSCASTAGCLGGFCDIPSGACCAPPSGATLYVDGTAGQVGQACCGQTAGAGACAFLADAVRIAGDLQTSGMILSVANAPKDSAAVQVSYGIVVKAPNIKLPPLRIARFANDTSTSVTVEGASGQPVQFFNTTGIQITVNDSMALYLVNAAVTGTFGQTQIQVNPGGALRIGYDGASNTGTVTFDSTDVNNSAGTAITCNGTAAAPASIDDLQVAVGTSLTIKATNNHLVIGDYCNVTLQANPTFGATPPDCSQFRFFDQVGLLVDGLATVNISNATFQCFQAQAIEMQATRGLGAPTVSGNFNVIQNSGTGVQCNAGTFSMAATTITANRTGVVQADDTVSGTTGTVDLSGGGNQVFCNSTGFPGADVVNLSASAGLNAKRVAWDLWDVDAGATELWNCDALFDTCTCTGAASCSLHGSTLENGPDTVTTNGILIDDTGGSQVAKPCL